MVYNFLKWNWRKLLCKQNLFSVFFVLCAIYWFVPRTEEIHSSQPGNEMNQNENKDILFIGITSSPYNFLQRHSLRSTWLSKLPNLFYYRFLVGRKMCEEHPQDRISEFDCETWKLTIPNNVTETTLFYANKLNLNDDDEETEAGIGFVFCINHPVVIKYLGIKKNSVIEGLARVVLTDLTSSTKIASVTFNSDSFYTDHNNEGYIYKKLRNPVMLPKGFEGSVRVEEMIETREQLNYEERVEWSHGNLLNILGIIRNNSTKKMNISNVLSTFAFTIRDLDQLRSHEDRKHQRADEWSLYTRQVYKQLQQEVVQYNDILLLDMVDVYRNLPQKVLLFIEWVYKHHNVKYILKTDDDTFIDIPTVKVELNKHSDWDWWSCFRIGWPVHRRGKWRETVYQQEVYPPFPSGAGYVLSHHVLTWLNTRIETLSTKYQGEDVALGIWLEAMNASRHVGEACYWACNEKCHSHTCNAMQLTVEEMYQVWSDYKECGDKICRCPNK
uniref:Hexosyltransferase n=1 Tax=Cuerna arida TaxID=1464854 RepID=A0A1B6GAZ9_9HEMI